jgi:putative ABC transport system permease protein
VRQFLAEAMLTSSLAGMLSLVLLHALLPGFRNLVGKPWLAIPYLENPAWLLAPVGMFLLVGALAGIYPAVFLSSCKPASVLGGRGSSGRRRSPLRNGLVVFQFSLSILLLVATCIIQKQMDFIQSQNLGYDQEQVAVVKTYGEVGRKFPALKEVLLRHPGIVSVSASSSVPGAPFTNVGMGLEGTSSSRGTNIYIADEDFLKTMDMEMAAGRFVTSATPSDGQAVIVNESMARELGGGDLLGRRLRIWIGGEGMTPFHIIGIIRDFHYESFLEPIKPLAIVRLSGACQWPEEHVSIRVQGHDMRNTLADIRESWRAVAPGLPFVFSFLDSIYDSQYQNESRTSHVFVIFTVFAVLVACIGLLGLASFAIEQRSKETGIRKVLGASAQGLALMLGWEFVRWAALANLIAWPAAYLIMRRWLHHFAYRTEMGAWPFLLSALIMLGVTGLTVSYHTVRSAVANPVNSLRHE